MVSEVNSCEGLVSLRYCNGSPGETTPIAEHNITWWEKSLWSVGVSCVPSQPPAHPSLLRGGAECEKEAALVLCQHSSAAVKRMVCYQHCFGHTSKTKLPRGCYEENSLHPSQTPSAGVLTDCCRPGFLHARVVHLFSSPN